MSAIDNRSPILSNLNEERAACGTGFSANVSGVADRKIVEHGLAALDGVVHRGAVGADGSTGDGAGILTQIPFKLLAKEKAMHGITLEEGEVAVAQVFMPKNRDLNIEATGLFYSILRKNGIDPLTVRERDVPVDFHQVSQIAQNSAPEFKQLVFPRPAHISKENFENFLRGVLYDLESEMKSASQGVKENFYIPSLSSRVISYKGLLRADQVSKFYVDLQNKDYESAFAVFHARFSTNTISRWQSAHPFRQLAHNGEINTIKGNIAAFSQFLKEKYGKELYIDPNFSDSARLDLIIGFYLSQGMDLADIVMSISRPAFRQNPKFSQEVKDYFEHRALEFIQADGPQLLNVTDGHKIITHTDSFGLRPASCVITKTGQVYVSSEFDTNHIDKSTIDRQINFSAGGALVVDLLNNTVKINDEVIQDLASQKVNGQSFGESLAARKITLSGGQRAARENAVFKNLESLQRATGVLHDELSSMVDPAAKEGKNPLGAMGPGIPNPALSHLPKRVSDYISHRFAQVSNPPLDSEREVKSMNLVTYLGAHPQKVPGAKFVKLDSPVLRPGQLENLISNEALGSVTIDTVFDVTEGEEGLSAALQTIGAAAVEAARKGSAIIVLSDANISEKYSAIDMTLAVAAADRALREAGLRLNCSIVANSAQITNSHHQACLHSFGANAINPYGLYEYLEQKHSSAEKSIQNVLYAFDKGMMKIMAKMGVADINAYISARLVEAKGLNLKGELGDYLGNIDSKFDGHRLRELAQNQIAIHAAALYAENPDKVLELFPQLGHEITDKNNFWHDVQQLFLNTVELSDQGLPRFGLFSFRQGGEKRSRGADAITEYRKAESNHNTHDKILTAVLKSYFDGAEHIENASEWLDANLPDGTKYLKAQALDIIASGQIPAYLKPRREGEPCIYTAEQIDAHILPEDTRNHNHHQQNERLKNPISTTDLLTITSLGEIEVNKVVPASAILKSWRTAAMSHGSTQLEAHMGIAKVANNIGMTPNSGEGGEIAERNPGGLLSDARSKARQIASGRFGVTLAYLEGADEIEIKVAQGAKPGEGGQLMGNKVTVQIAAIRRGYPGADLISPPPHHDMYSIEDLEQLIRDAKTICPNIAVKLVASEGIGTIACGVAKCGATKITVGGGAGGTGAAELQSIHHAGMEVQQGVREVHQALVQQGLRDNVKITQSGSMITPLDVVVAYLNGADLAEFGTEALIKAGGCKKADLCHQGCPVFITTDGGKYDRPSRIGEREFIYFAHAVREELARLGFTSPEDARGRINEVASLVVSGLKERGIRGEFDFSRFLAVPKPLAEFKPERPEISYSSPEPIDAEILSDLEKILLVIKQENKIPEGLELNGLKVEQKGAKVIITYDKEITNCNSRSFGAKLSSLVHKYFYDRSDLAQAEVDKRNGKQQLPLNNPIEFHFKGTAGNSFGVWNYGIASRVEGIANDYFGKGMSSGVLALTPYKDYPESYQPEQNAIVGNKTAFGATGGEMYIWGSAGEKFLVRNSGATVVLAGNAGEYACEYMTRGSAIILGEVGPNFGTGMSGGVVAIYDPKGKFEQQGANYNTYTAADLISASNAEFSGVGMAIAGQLRRFIKYTTLENGRKCELADHILNNLDTELANFKFVVPKALAKDISFESILQIKEAFKTAETSPLERTMQNRIYESRVAAILNQESKAVA